METKEKWMEEMMRSLDALEAAPISPLLLEKLRKEIPTSPKTIVSIRPQVKWAVAAGILVLIGINILSLIQFYHAPKELSTNENPVFIEYFAFLNKEQ